MLCPSLSSAFAAEAPRRVAPSPASMGWARFGRAYSTFRHPTPSRSYQKSSTRCRLRIKREPSSMNSCISPAASAAASDPTRAMLNAKTWRRCIGSCRVIGRRGGKGLFFHKNGSAIVPMFQVVVLGTRKFGFTEQKAI
jgi:hypothetical protein